MSAKSNETRLNGCRSGGGYVAKCPAHEDRTPSLDICDATSGKVLVHCHAGCDRETVTEALRGLGLLVGIAGERPLNVMTAQKVAGGRA